MTSQLLSFSLISRQFVANLPAAARSEMPFHPLLIKLLSIVQPTILLSIAVFIGFQLAHRVGLSAPAAEALAKGSSFITALKPQVLPGLIAGFIAGVAILSSWLLFRPILPSVFVTRAERLNGSMPLLTRLRYGGITEELLLRWGLLTLLVGTAWRMFQRGRGTPRAIFFVSASLNGRIVFPLRLKL